jgi:hypothetical protein
MTRISQTVMGSEYAHIAKARKSGIPAIAKKNPLYAFPNGRLQSRHFLTLPCWPVGQIGSPSQKPCQVLLKNKNRFTISPNQIYGVRVPFRRRGVSRSSRTWATECGGRGVSQRSIASRTNGMLRTVKSCGPGIPVLMPCRRASVVHPRNARALSRTRDAFASRDNGGKKAGPRGEPV